MQQSIRESKQPLRTRKRRGNMSAVTLPLMRNDKYCFPMGVGVVVVVKLVVKDKS
jgi:hypothetical protein